MNYFKLERGKCRGDLISAYIFILLLEVVLAVIKSNQNIDKLRQFEHDFLYTAYVDDIVFFVKVFDNFSKILVWSQTNQNVKLLE